MRIREAGIGDVAGVVEMSGALFGEDAGSRDASTNLDWPEEEGCEYFSALIMDGECVCFLAGSGGEVVGYLAGRLKAGSTLRPVRVAELESMYVREGHRGLGVGEALAGEFMRWGRSKGARRASVTAHAANERAIRFYKRIGFLPMRVSLEMCP